MKNYISKLNNYILFSENYKWKMKKYISGIKNYMSEFNNYTLFSENCM